ncbi:MAG: 4-(cytidine 5'-diphospho)-2-C-methyl-D-erythritol kinase [Lachnospiraceae bacterium]|nr:4-(cytidine 5'-diphospho)-2-C-methyl-D-erythritol kinase [Lachnospiraceae bacterium]
MKQIRLKAMAKVNLGLDVVGKREDGYHEVRMIMQTVNLYDKIFISVSEKPGIRLKTNLNFLPVNENNLIYKAAKLLMDEFEIKEGVDIQLQKFIPVAAGMAGGSTDAATTLIGMNHLFDLGLSRRQLMERSVKLGADVPYCVTGGTALSEGIGEILTRLPDVPRGYVLVAKPGISVSTKFVYTNLKLDQLEKHPDIDAQIEAIRRQDFVQMARLMGNVLETVTIPEYPVVQEIKDFMMDCGAVNAMMSGSGPTVFGLYTNQIQAEKACERLRDAGLAKMVFLTTFVGQNPYA